MAIRAEQFEFEVVSHVEFLKRLGSEKMSLDLHLAVESFISPLLDGGNALNSNVVLSVHSKITGTIGAFSYLQINQRDCNVWCLYVEPMFRGEGLGSVCLRHSVGAIVARGVRRIFVGFIDPLAAQGRLYKRFCDEVLPLYRPVIRFCIVAPDVPEKSRVWDWIPLLS